MGGFFRTFFEALKDGTKYALAQIYITGILPITIADMNSGFNIANWITFEPDFINMLGITESEFEILVDNIYNEHHIAIDKQIVKQTIKNYYHGYRFSIDSEKVYNPMMTLYFLNVVTYNFTIDYFEKLQNFIPDQHDISRWMVAYLSTGDIEKLIQGFFEDIIRKFPGDFFANVNERYYHGLFFHVLFTNTTSNLYKVIPEFNLPHGQADVMIQSYPGAKVRCNISDLFEIKRVKKDASDSELKTKLNEGVSQMQKYLQDEYVHWRGVVVCFRGNKDYVTEIITAEQRQ